MQSPDKERSKKMTLKEAYEKWGKQKQRQTLYIKTRSAFMQVWRKLDFDTPCKMLTLSVLTEAMKKRGPVFVEDKTRAASVMVHVLNFAHDEAPGECPMPTFDYRAILDGAEAMPLPTEKEQKERKVLKLERKEPKLERKVLKSEQNTPVMEQRKQTRVTPKNPYQGERDTLGRSKNRAKRKVAQIDPSTLKVVRVWESMGAAEHGLGIKNISRAIDKKRLAGGFYWCDEKDLSSFEAFGDDQVDVLDTLRVDHNNLDESSKEFKAIAKKFRNRLVYKNVDLFINDMNKSLTTSYDGKFSTKVKLNATGTWIIKAIFNGNEACKACNATMSFDVSKRKTTLKMNVSDLFLNREATLTGNLTDKTNTKLRNANIYVVVNGKRYHVLTNENGTYVVNYTPTKKGTNNLTVLYKGNPNYEASNITTTFEVDEDIVIRSTYYRDSITITACLTDGNELLKNVKVNLTINNETVSVKTDENGILYYACKSKIAGNNMLEICYGNQKWTRNFVTEKRSTSLTFKVSKITLNQQCTITGNLTDQSGTKLRNANIYVTLNGQRYHLLTDVFGTYSLNFTPTQVGKYNITVLYKGNSNYSPSQLNKTITVK